MSSPAAAKDGLEVVAEWNSLPGAVKDAATRNALEKSNIYGKALIQDAKFDSQGNIYVTALSLDCITKLDAT
nr:hypothetical protein [uncultured Cohaesibacter sp.]